MYLCVEGFYNTTAEEVSGSVDFLDTRRTPQRMKCICNIVVIVERCVIVDIIDIVGSGGVIGSGSGGSNACASVGSRAFFLLACRNEQQLTNI